MDVMQNADGRLEVFARGIDVSLIHTWQASEGGWSEWESLGRPRQDQFWGVNSAPAVGRNADGRLEVFAIANNTDGATPHYLTHIWQTSPNGTWSGFASLGGSLKSRTAPAVVLTADGRLEVFAVTPDNAVWHVWQASGGNWSAWSPLGGSILGAPVAIRNADDGRVFVFGRGTDGQLHVRAQTAPNVWGPSWVPLGGKISAAPSVAQNADGRLEVFALGPVRGIIDPRDPAASAYGVLRHIWEIAPGGRWSEWADMLRGERLEAPFETPSAARNADGRLEVFGIEQTEVIHAWQDGAKAGWLAGSLEGGYTTTPVAVSNRDGRLEVFVVGTDDRLYHIWQTGPSNGWSGWERIGEWQLTDAGRTVIKVQGQISGHA